MPPMYSVSYPIPRLESMPDLPFTDQVAWALPGSPGLGGTAEQAASDRSREFLRGHGSKASRASH
jgi:hypothetical protein